MTGIEFRIKFVSDAHEPDFLVSVDGPGECMGTVIRRIKEAKSLPPGQHVRILCSGRELYADDSVTKPAARVLHCMLTDVEPQRPAPAPLRKVVQPPPPPVVEQPPVDWLDVVDPGTVLMWIFGSILALLWLLFVFYAHMFDRTSVVLLVMMTVAFLIPCVLSYLPWPTFLQPARAAPGPYDTYDPATGMSTAMAGQAAWQRHPCGGDIPPRPSARRPGS